jgi:hypothetical protein
MALKKLLRKNVCKNNNHFFTIPSLHFAFKEQSEKIMKQFRLLRNNQESGPFSAEQLIQMGLKAYDLIWEEGRSAAWRYPSEIGELKAFAPAIEEQPFDRFFKQTEEKNVSVAAVAKKEKPRIRIKADWNKVEQPAPVTEIKQTAQPVFAPQNISGHEKTSWHDAWLDWKEEKKVVTTNDRTGKKPGALYSHINTKNEVPLETKFSQSLDDIKERYVESILKNREKKAFSFGPIFQKKNLMAVVLVSLIGWGIYVGFVMNNTDDKKAVAAAKTAPTVVIPTEISDSATQATQPVNNEEENNTVADNSDNTETNKNELPKPSENKNIALQQASNHIAKQKNTPLVKTSVPVNFQPAYKKPVNQNGLAKNNYPLRPPVITPAGHSAVVQQSDGQYVRTVARRTDNGAVNQPQTNVPLPANRNTNYASAEPAKKRIEDLVTVSAENVSPNSVENVHLSVQNNTDAPIDMAVLDIQYYDARGKFQKGETVYINNIPPDDNVDVKVPDSRNSNHINYKVSLVSAGQKTLVAD